MDKKPLMTTGELAKMLNVHGHTVRLWAKEGKIPYIKLSATNYRFDYDEVIKALKEDK